MFLRRDLAVHVQRQWLGGKKEETNFRFYSTNFRMLHKMFTQARTSPPSAENSLCYYGLCSLLLPNVRSKRIPWVNRMGLKSLENSLEARLDLHAWWNLPFRIRGFLLNLNETQRKENLSHSQISPLQREFFWGINWSNNLRHRSEFILWSHIECVFIHRYRYLYLKINLFSYIFR